MKSVFLLFIELYLGYFPTLAQSESYLGQAQEVPDTHHSTRRLQGRQIPGVIGASQFLRRGFHACECAVLKAGSDVRVNDLQLLLLAISYTLMGETLLGQTMVTQIMTIVCFNIKP